MSDDVTETTDREAELERLRAENDALRAELEHKRTQRSAEGARRWISVVLAVLVAILVPLSTLTVWTQRTALDTDQYVETVAPLAGNEAIQDRVIEVISDEINAQVDFAGLLEEQIEQADLPEPLSLLVGPLAGGAEALVERVVAEIVRSDAFATLWEEAQREGHATVVAVLTGDGVAGLATDDGRIRIPLTPLVERATEQVGGLLGDDFVSRLGLGGVDADIVLFESQELADAQWLVDLLDTLSWWVPAVAILLLVLVVVVAKDRRLGTRRAGLALLLPALVSLGLLALLRGRIVGRAVDEEAARAALDILLRFLVQQLRVLAVLGAVLLLVAWAFGPSRSGTTVRSWFDSLLGRATAVDDPATVGAVPVWVARARPALSAGIVVLAGVVLILADRPTGWTVFLIALVAAVLLAVVEGLARIGRQAVAAEGVSAT